MSDPGSVTVRVDDRELQAMSDALVTQAGAEGVPAALAAKDDTLWGPDAQPEAANRLGWLDCATASRPLIPELAGLRRDLADRGVDRVVLAGMGGSSLAPEVIAGSYGVPLVVVDTTDPGQIRAAAGQADELARTVVVVSSKSGGTLETDSHRRFFEAAFRAAGIDPVERLVVVTDPDSPLDGSARQAGYRVINADPSVGGRYSALTAFGLVPAALAGVPVVELLDAAATVLPALSRPDGNPGLSLGATLAGGARLGRDKVILVPGAAGPGVPVGFGDWAEQLIAESTGKRGTGLLPVVVEAADAPGTGPEPDSHLVRLGGEPPTAGTSVSGPLGAQFLVWEYATAFAGRLLGIDPFDQPNVQESKDNTNRVLEAAGDGELPDEAPAFVERAVAIYADPDLLAGATSLAGALTALLATVPDRGYLAVMAYLDRFADAAAAQVRGALAARLPHPVTFGWAPRFLHSTGQFHKGGPAVGAFLQISGVVADDLAIPGRPFSFGKLQQAQALGDRQALSSRHRPLLRLHLLDRAAGLEQLLEQLLGAA
ncbi:MAG TPA: glucose-6-phosphate isomerase [Mycobacteriales bacterium]|nr:glucose-6-phosphate isomerase [Mycobacteriales bacterium]